MEVITELLRISFHNFKGSIPRLDKCWRRIRVEGPRARRARRQPTSPLIIEYLVTSVPNLKTWLCSCELFDHFFLCFNGSRHPFETVN